MKSTILTTMVAALTVTSVSCTPLPPPEPPVVIGDVSDDASVCGRACSALRAWKRPEGFPVNGGASCEEDCVRTTSAGLGLGFGCIARSATLATACQCKTKHGAPALRCN